MSQWESPFACPHCGVCHSNEQPMCEPGARWTQEERDEWRRLVRSHDPAAQFAPSSQWMAAHYGDRSRR